MVSSRLVGPARAAAGTAALAAALTLAACGGGEGPAAVPDSSAAARAAERVRREYTARDVLAAGAFAWQAGDSLIFVLVDAQSAIDGLVQARADLWMVNDTFVLPIARSDVMPSAAEFGAWAFEDLTGDGLPDFFGYVADSAAVSYPVFLPGADGTMADELASAAPGYTFETTDSVPSVVRGPRRACALRLWAEAPAPAGWRYLALFPDGTLQPPAERLPACE